MTRYFEHKTETLDIVADPMAVWAKIEFELQGQFGDVWEDSKSDDVSKRYGAELKLIEATNRAFGLKAFDPKDKDGVMRDETLAALLEFVRYLNKKKENGG